MSSWPLFLAMLCFIAAAIVAVWRPDESPRWRQLGIRRKVK